MEARISARAAALYSASSVKSASMIEVCVRVIEGVVISEDSAVGLVVVIVETNVVVVPVVSPMVPAPAKATEVADAEAVAKLNSRSGKIESWIPIPAWPDPDRRSIHEPGIIFRHVNDLRIGRLDHDCLTLLADCLLRSAI